MNVTFLLTQSLESPGGGGRFFPLAKYLARFGHHVTIIALHHDYASARPRRFMRDNVRVWYVGQMHVHKFESHKRYFSPLALIWVTALSTLRLTLAVLRTPSDAIHVCKTQPMNGLAAWVAHRVRRTPIYLDSDDYEAVNNRFSGRWQQRIVSWCEDWMPSFAQGITCNTSFIANRFCQLGYPADRIILIPNGVDRERFAPIEEPALDERLDSLRQSLGIRPSDRVIVYIGSMSTTSHAVDLLLEAFSQVSQAEPNALLLLVGGGEDLILLQQQAENLGVANRVTFVGRVPAEDVPLYYCLGDVSTDPLRDSVPARSSLSLKLVESIVASVPCVTADIGDRQQVVREAGIAVPPDDECALATAILTILQDTEAANAMRTAASAMREAHFWENKIHAFLEVYQ